MFKLSRYTSPSFLLFVHNGTFLTFCLFPGTKKPFQYGSCCERKEFTPKGTKGLPLLLTPIVKEGKKENGQSCFSERLKLMKQLEYSSFMFSCLNVLNMIKALCTSLL